MMSLGEFEDITRGLGLVKKEGSFCSLTCSLSRNLWEVGRVMH